MDKKVNSLICQTYYKGKHLQFSYIDLHFFFNCTECYSEASDHEEAESTDIPPPPYSFNGPSDIIHEVRSQSPFKRFWDSFEIGMVTLMVLLRVSHPLGKSSTSVFLTCSQRSHRYPVVPRQHHDLSQFCIISEQTQTLMAGSGVTVHLHRWRDAGLFCWGPYDKWSYISRAPRIFI